METEDCVDWGHWAKDLFVRISELPIINDENVPKPECEICRNFSYLQKIKTIRSDIEYLLCHNCRYNVKQRTPAEIGDPCQFCGKYLNVSLKDFRGDNFDMCTACYSISQHTPYCLDCRKFRSDMFLRPESGQERCTDCANKYH